MLLEIEGLNIDLPTPDGARRIVKDVSFTLERGATLGVVGESGSGKTMTALALMGLLPEGAMTSGAIRFDDRDLTKLDETQWREIRGDRIAMIFQEPMTALNPLHTIGRQIAEPLGLHRGLSRNAAMVEAVRLLARVGLPDPERRARAFPHQLSGGQRQRAMIAMALSCGPKLVVADEPTTALDVTVQAQILDLIATLGAESGLSVLLVSHDLAVIARHCARVVVMYGGAVMEEGPVEAVLGQALHPYTRALLAARPTLGGVRGARLLAIPGAAAAAAEGCAFATRCPLALPACRNEPPSVALPGGHVVACVRVTSEGRLT